MSLTFGQPQHGGDRRKRSQRCALPGVKLVSQCSLSFEVNVAVRFECRTKTSGKYAFSAGILAVSSIHKTFGFTKAHALLGTLGPVIRARVSDLITDDADRPCSPAHRVFDPVPDVVGTRFIFSVVELSLYVCTHSFLVRFSKGERRAQSRFCRSCWREWASSLVLPFLLQT